MTVTRTLSGAILASIVMASVATPAMALSEEPKPSPYIVTGSSFMQKKAADDPFEYNNKGQRVNSTTSFASSDIFALRAGDKIALDVLKNDTLTKDHTVKNLKVYDPATKSFVTELAMKGIADISIVEAKGNSKIQPVERYTGAEGAIADSEGRPYIAWNPTEVDFTGEKKIFYSAEVTNTEGAVIGKIQSYFVVGIVEGSKAKLYCESMSSDNKPAISPWEELGTKGHFTPSNYADTTVSPFCPVTTGKDDAATVEQGKSVSVDILANDIPKYNYAGEVSVATGYKMSPDSVVIKGMDKNVSVLPVEGKGEWVLRDGHLTFTALDTAEGDVSISYDALGVKPAVGEEPISAYKVSGKTVTVKITKKPEPVVVPAPEVKEVEVVKPVEEDKLVSAAVVTTPQVATTPTAPEEKIVAAQAVVPMASPGEEEPVEQETLVPVVTPVAPSEIPNAETIEESSEESEDAVVETPVELPIKEEEEEPSTETDSPKIIKDGGENIFSTFFAGILGIAGIFSLLAKKVVRVKL